MDSLIALSSFTTRDLVVALAPMAACESSHYVVVDSLLAQDRESWRAVRPLRFGSARFARRFALLTSH